MGSYKIGVLGLGFAGEAQVKAFQENPNTQGVAAHTRNRERLAQMAEQYQIEKPVESYDELLDSGIDVVVICTPDQLHTDYVLQALNQGINILCEKPLATSLDDARTMVSAAKNSGRIFMTGQCARFFDRSQFAKQLMDRGELGEVFFAESDYLHNVLEFLHGWRIDPECPQNMVLGGGCHPMDLVRWFLGDVETVYAFANKKAYPDDVPIEHDCILMRLKFKSGAIGKILVSIGCQRPYSLGLRLYGTEGTLVDEKFFLARYGQFEDFMDARLPAHSHDFNHVFDEQAVHLVDCLDKGEQPIADAVEGAKTVASSLAGVDSIETGQPVAVAEVE